MKKTSETIVFFGNERLATGVTTEAPTLQALIAAGYNIAAIVSSHEYSSSRNARTLEIEEVAKKHHIPLLLPEKLHEIANQLRSYKATIGVLVAYGKFVPESIIDIFPRGIVNIHPSLLPAHRGPTPIESAMLEGSKETGVSLMKLVKAMDAGPIYAQQKVTLGKDSKQQLTDKLLRIGGELLLDHLPAIIGGSLTPQPQDDHLAAYDSKIRKEDGVIDWRKSAAQIEREVRAYAGWPKSRTTLGHKEVAITEAGAIDAIGTPGALALEASKLVIYCKLGALEINRLIPAGKKEMTAQAFLAGYRNQL